MNKRLPSRKPGGKVMIDPQDSFEAGIRLHGHRCPAMPLGLRAGAAAMNALGVERAPDGQLVAVLELGESHFATCFADGVQTITGCTYGKGNVKRLGYGKWGLTLYDRATGRAVRVSPRAEFLAASQKTPFFLEYRSQGVPASQVPADVVDPLVERVMTVPEEKLLQVGEVFDAPLEKPSPVFQSFVCEACGEMTVESYGRVLGDKRVCIPCEQAAVAS